MDKINYQPVGLGNADFPKNWITESCSPNNKYANKITNGLYTVSTRAEIPAPIIFREWRKRISASPIPIIPLIISRI